MGQGWERTTPTKVLRGTADHCGPWAREAPRSIVLMGMEHARRLPRSDDEGRRGRE